MVLNLWNSGTTANALDGLRLPGFYGFVTQAFEKYEKMIALLLT